MTVGGSGADRCRRTSMPRWTGTCAPRRSSRGTRNEYHSTVRKWEQWGSGVPIEELQRKNVREFLDWVYERAVADQGTNPGRTVNKAREHLRAVLSWAWEQELIDAPPRFPKPRPQRDVAGRHYLTKAELNALYFATHQMKRPRGWKEPFPVGRYWRAALVVFFNYGVDTGTDLEVGPGHEPILWRHVTWDPQSPDREAQGTVQMGMAVLSPREDRQGVLPADESCRSCASQEHPAEATSIRKPPYSWAGEHARTPASRNCARWPASRPRANVETGMEEPWELKDLRKTCATYYDQHLPESSIEILGHSVGGITYRHYAHRPSLAFKAIMTIPQPTAFSAADPRPRRREVPVLPTTICRRRIVRAM